MKRLTPRAAALAIALSLSLAPALSAHAAHGPDATAAEVRKVDKGAGKITLKHAEIKSLDMPAMSMVFHVTDPSVLDRYKPGDKVRFTAKDDGGRYVILTIHPEH